MNPLFHIGLGHFLVVSFLLAAAGIATMLTKRNAIGILIGVELVLNAAAVNFVAFNRYGWPSERPASVEVALDGVGSLVASELPHGIELPAQETFAIDSTLPVDADATAEAIAAPGEVEADATATVTEAPAGADTETPAAADQAGAAMRRAREAEVVERPPRPAIHGQMFAIFIIVLAAAEAAVALAIFLNFYNNFSSIDVERADELKG